MSGVLFVRRVYTRPAYAYPSILRHATVTLCVARHSIMAEGGASCTLETLKFVNSAVRTLPMEKDENYVRSVQGACFSQVKPTPVKNPALVAHSLPALTLLGLPPTEAGRPELLEYFSGNWLLPGSEPAAHCYCGHQFGLFSGQLGDGCAILLGEVEKGSCERWELQLKGSGKTPFSRTADGRKVLRSSIREFLCSEAMHHLGVPTTRAGTCITSDDYVIRDIFYNGNPIQERATVISRIAPSFIRFGSFEIFKPRDLMTGAVGPSIGLKDILHQLVDYVTENFYPEIHSVHGGHRGARTAALFHEVCMRTARLVALWQCVGFCHGVLNTDNMSILGLTIDYGPFGFLDKYDPGHICNASDNNGRYAYDKQPAICQWNLKKLSEALAIGGLTEEMSKEGLRLYDAEFENAYLNKMRLKLGLVQKELPEDIDLVESLLDTMHKTGCDFTNGFNSLSSIDIPTPNSKSDVVLERMNMVAQCSTPQELVKGFGPLMKLEQLEMLATHSPQLLGVLGFPPDTLQTEFQRHKKLGKLKTMSIVEKTTEDEHAWDSWLTTYRERLKMEAECDGKTSDEVRKERLKAMSNNNPKIVLRNHIAQKAIDMAERGDYSEVQSLLKLLETPYSDAAAVHGMVGEQSLPSNEGASPDVDAGCKVVVAPYMSKPPVEALGIQVS